MVTSTQVDHRCIRLQPWEPVSLSTTHMHLGGRLLLPQRLLPHQPPLKRVCSRDEKSTQGCSDICPGIQFKHSPFFRIEKAVSSIVECPGVLGK